MAIEYSVAQFQHPDRKRWLRYEFLSGLAAAVDVGAIVVVSLICGVTYGNYLGVASHDLSSSFALGSLFAALFVPLAHLYGLYRPLEMIRPLKQIAGVVAIWLLVATFLAVVGFALKMGHTMSRGATMSFVVSGGFVVCVLRLFWQRAVARALAQGAFATRRVALIGSKAELDGDRLPRKLRSFGLSIVARVRLDDKVDDNTIDRVIANTTAAFRGSEVEEIIIVQDGMLLPQVRRLIVGLRILPLPVRLILDSDLSALISRPVQHFGGAVAVEMSRAPMTAMERSTKRVLDIVVAGSALIVLSPLLAAIAGLVRLDSRGPILFRQSRNGFNNQPFKILKFRSMNVMEDGAAIKQAARHDQRVTRVGRWLRRSSIDELPQLWNVLRGEMSIVGPRPHAVAHDAHYEALIGDYPFRQHVKPGLTGWAQVNGSRGETPTTESMVERVKLDIWYVENWSLLLDIRIMAKTVFTVLNSKNTY